MKSPRNAIKHTKYRRRFHTGVGSINMSSIRFSASLRIKIDVKCNKLIYFRYASITNDWWGQFDKYRARNQQRERTSEEKWARGYFNCFKNLLLFTIDGTQQSFSHDDNDNDGRWLAHIILISDIKVWSVKGRSYDAEINIFKAIKCIKNCIPLLTFNANFSLKIPQHFSLLL